MSPIRATVVRREAMIVGDRKVNGLHGLFRFRSLAAGLGETRNLLVKCVKGVSWCLLWDSEASPEVYAWLSRLNWTRLLEDNSWPAGP